MEETWTAWLNRPEGRLKKGVGSYRSFKTEDRMSPSAPGCTGALTLTLYTSRRLHLYRARCEWTSRDGGEVVLTLPVSSEHTRRLIVYIPGLEAPGPIRFAVCPSQTCCSHFRGWAPGSQPWPGLLVSVLCLARHHNPCPLKESPVFFCRSQLLLCLLPAGDESGLSVPGQEQGGGIL